MSACPKCGSALAETGAPIWETYCPNKDCTHDYDKFKEGLRALQKQETDTIINLRAKLEKAREVLRLWEVACSVDATMEGPKVRVSPIRANKAWVATASVLKEISDE